MNIVVNSAMNANGDEFGAERLLEIVGSGREKTPRNIVDDIFTAVEAFRQGAAPNDDMTAVAVKISS